MKCRHCHAKPANRPRGLCWTCFHSPARDLYPLQDRVSTKRPCRTCGEPMDRPDEAPCATCQRPEGMRQGYRERIALYATRAAESKPLFDRMTP